MIADKGYDSDRIVGFVRKKLRARAVIPSLKCRKKKRRHGRKRYKARNVVERFWSKAKQYRRVCTRYDKLDASFAAFVHLASVMIVLRSP